VDVLSAYPAGVAPSSAAATAPAAGHFALFRRFPYTACAVAIAFPVIAETAAKLKTIGDLETVAEKPMVMGMGIDYERSLTIGKP
jgi:hypothetical protein